MANGPEFEGTPWANVPAPASQVERQNCSTLSFASRALND